VYYVTSGGILVHNSGHVYRDKIDDLVGMSKPSQKRLLDLPSKPTNKLPRFDGPKPAYAVNPAHARGTLQKRKTPLPSDAGEVFRHAVPDDPVKPRHWYGRNADGQIYRFSNGNDGTAHFSGVGGVGDGIRNVTLYALQRLEEMF
jgi:hypothetical protein